MRRKLIAGNWKMHGTKASVQALISALLPSIPASVEVAVLSPAIFIPSLEVTLEGSRLLYGAEDVSEEQQAGAFTGDISASMLAEFGCRYVIVGHSERRALRGETDAVVAKKFMAAQAAGLIPILCVGETLSEREAGLAEAVVTRQLQAVSSSFANAVIAYEPVWAIGTGKTPTAAEVQAIHAVIRQVIASCDAEIAKTIQILYGGSVKAENARVLLSQPNVDGALVGGASLRANEFLSICESVS